MVLFYLIVSLIISEAVADKPRVMLKSHPKVETMVVNLVNEKSVNVTWERPPGVSAGEITKYQVHVRQMLHDSLDVFARMVDPPTRSLYVSHLIPKVVYNLRVETIFSDKLNSMSAVRRFTTTDANASSVCLCDPLGSVNGTGRCRPNSLDCVCKNKHYTGVHCSICGPNHVRRPFGSCDRCACHPNTSTGRCEFRADLNRITCIGCKDNRAGPFCDLCQPHFRIVNESPHQSHCAPCDCPKLPNASRPLTCNVVSGDCHCPNGTVGKRCERCAPGWAGTAPACRPSVLPPHSRATVVTAVVALVVVALALLLGYWAMRVRARRKRLNAWSLELNRYELEQPGLGEAGSHAGLMMDEAPTPGLPAAAPAGGRLGYGGARLQLRQAEPGEEDPRAAATKNGPPLV